jgi:hypothetical protein
MSQAKLELIGISDEQALAAIESVVPYIRDSNPQNISFNVMLFDNEPTVGYASLDDIRAKLASVFAQHGSLIRSLSAGFNLQNNSGNGSVGFNREPSGMATATIRLDGAFFDNTPANRIAFVAPFNKAFDDFHRRELLARLQPELADFYTRRESSLLRLEEIATRAAENTESHRRKLDDQFESRRQALDDEYKQRVEQLEAEAGKKDKAIEAKEKALSDREAALEKADNTHARRRLRQDLKTVLKERHTKFTLTSETERKRDPIYWVFTALMITTAAASVYFGWLAGQPIPQGLFPWLPSLRVALSVSGFAGAAIYFIRWQDRWSQTHADEEFRLKRLDLDVDRASWLVEVLLEWRGDEGKEIPPALIEKLANGLFDPGQPSPFATHPVEDAIASLLASPASLKLTLPGGEVNLDKKAIDRAKSMNA